MRTRPTFMVLAAAGWTLALSVPAAAAQQPTSFFEIEQVVGEDGIRDAELALVERIAGRGVRIEQARAALEKAGGSYIGSKKAGQLEFLYAAPETFVTVILRDNGIVVTSVEIRRQTLGV